MTFVPDVAWLRACCARSAPAAPSSAAPGAGAGEAEIPAAVLIPVIARESGLTVLLTERTPHLRDHAGQVSFPGGRCEPHDASARETALRESHEEVGLRPEQVDVLAILPEYSTRTGFRVTPVLGLVTPPINLRLDDFEVAEVFEPPLAFFLDAANYRRESIQWQEAMRHFWAIPWRGHFIWGATAGMLFELRAYLLDAS